MHISTILSRATRAKAKTLSPRQLADEVDYCYKLAIKWMVIPGGTQQANKYWQAVTFYENLLKKLKSL